MKYRYLALLLAIAPMLFLNAQGFDPALAANLQQTLDSMKNAQQIKGISAAVAIPGQGKWLGVSGLSHNGSPMTPDMELGIGSNTKLFTATMVLLLSEKQLLSVDDSLYRWLPVFENIDSTITIRQLLRHTSGIADVNDVPGYGDSVLSQPNKTYTPEEVIGWVGTPLFAPGADWSYSNTNYLLAGMVAERAAGVPYGQLLHELILDTFQLQKTFLGAYDQLPDPIAHPWQNATDNNSTPRTALNSVARSAGAMYSTAADMADWYGLLFGGSILSPASLAEMANFSGPANYGFGVTQKQIFGRTVWEHSGAIWGGYNSDMMFDTASKAVIAVLTNSRPDKAVPVARQLLATLLSATSASVEPNAVRCLIHPNPATDRITCSIPNETVRSLRIFKPTGEELGGYAAETAWIGDLPPGFYWLQAQTDKRVYMSGWVKQ